MTPRRTSFERALVRLRVEHADAYAYVIDRATKSCSAAIEAGRLPVNMPGIGTIVTQSWLSGFVEAYVRVVDDLVGWWTDPGEIPDFDTPDTALVAAMGTPEAAATPNDRLPDVRSYASLARLLCGEGPDDEATRYHGIVGFMAGVIAGITDAADGYPTRAALADPRGSWLRQVRGALAADVTASVLDDAEEAIASCRRLAPEATSVMLADMRSLADRVSRGLLEPPSGEGCCDLSSAADAMTLALSVALVTYCDLVPIVCEVRRDGSGWDDGIVDMPDGVVPDADIMADVAEVFRRAATRCRQPMSAESLSFAIRCRLCDAYMEDMDPRMLDAEALVVAMARVAAMEAALAMCVDDRTLERWEDETRLLMHAALDDDPEDDDGPEPVA